MNTIKRIIPVIKDYPWGNDYFIPALVSKEPDGPMAELWIGAHKSGSATVEETGESLFDMLNKDPAFCGCTAEAFPYLLKVLAIGQCLSIQCHPDSVQATKGYEAEAEKRKTTDRKLWNYQDSSQKAEMLYALTPVTAMCGFRKFDEMKKLLKATVPNLYSEYLSEYGSIKDLFDGLYRLDKDVLSFGEAELLKNCDVLPEDIRTIVHELGDRYLGDPGVFSPLLLNVIHLKPGQAVYLKPCVLHAYIAGNGVELMNNSDNVLRGGLTSKHVDLDELEKVMNPDSYLPKPMDSVVDEGGRHFVCEGGFTLTLMENGQFRNTISGPKFMICTEGEADVNGVKLTKGMCCIAGTADSEITVRADKGTVFMASSN